MILTTERLVVREFTFADAEFIVRLLNDPSFIDNIADKGVRTLDDARTYLRDGPLASYARHGFGLWLVALSEGGDPIGICGLIRRDGLDGVDLGYALLPEFCGRGYALEAAAGVVAHARAALGLGSLLAIVNEDNAPSIRLLAKLGFQYQRMVRLAGDTHDVCLFQTAGGSADRPAESIAMTIEYRPIGYVHSPFEDIVGVPIQPSRAGEVTGTVHVLEEFAAGLADLDGFSHVILLCHLHRSHGYELQVVPFLDSVPRGLFATRAPRRPNPIGLSVVRLLGIKHNVLEIEGVDLVDGTPLLDIKPFVGEFDIRAGAIRTGWLERTSLARDAADGRFR